MHWIIHTIYQLTVSPSADSFWGGPGGDLGYLGILGVTWHHLNCEQPGCLRTVRHHQHHCRKHQRG